MDNRPTIAEVQEWVLKLYNTCEQTITSEERKEQHKYAVMVQRPQDKKFLVKMLDDAENQKTANAIDFRMAASANELNPLFLKGELDIMAVPANLGSVLYNKTEGQVKMLAVSTLGVLYIVEKGGETVTDIKSLAGKTIYATGKGATPEYALTYLLAQNGLELGRDVNVEWKSEPTEIVAQMAAMDNAVAMLPQPFVVVARSQVDGLRVALDLTKEWNALGGGSQLITAVLLVRSEFLEQHPQAVEKLLDEYAAPRWTA